MKKRIAIFTFVMLLAGAMQAQIFINEENSDRSGYANVEDIGVIPYHQVEHDQTNYLPLGNGLLMLSALGGAYLLKKRKTNKQTR